MERTPNRTAFLKRHGELDAGSEEHLLDIGREDNQFALFHELRERIAYLAGVELYLLLQARNPAHEVVDREASVDGLSPLPRLEELLY